MDAKANPETEPNPAGARPSPEDATAAIKALASKIGGDVCGIAHVRDWDEFVPEGYRPDDQDVHFRAGLSQGTCL